MAALTAYKKDHQRHERHCDDTDDAGARASSCAAPVLTIAVSRGIHVRHACGWIGTDTGALRGIKNGQ